MALPIHNLLTPTYDAFNRPEETKYGNTRYTYAYNANGQAAKVKFEKNNVLTRTFETEYDLALRPRRSSVLNGSGTPLYEATLIYDDYGRLEEFEEGVDSNTYRSDYAYDNDD